MGELEIALGEVMRIAASCPNLCGLSVGAGYTNSFLA